MNATDTLNRVKTILGLEVSLEQMKLENGTTIEAEKFEEGASVFIVTEDEKVALPIGEYELEDEKILIVVDEGVIAEIKEGKEEEEETQEEMEEEKKEMEYVSKEELTAALEEIKAMIEEVKAGYEKEEMSEEVVEETEETTEELSEVKETTEEEELKEELSKPATEPLKHSPEKEAKTEGFQFSKNRQMTALDRVMQKISNFK